MPSRTCESCKKSLPLSAFSQKHGKTNSTRCKTCERARRARLSSRDLDPHLKRTATVVRHRAKKQGVECSIDYETLLSMWKEQKGRCAVSGAPLTHHKHSSTGNIKKLVESPTNVSVDRINAGGPYTRENSMLVCSVVNMMRRNMGLDEFMMWCQLISDNADKSWSD